MPTINYILDTHVHKCIYIKIQFAPQREYIVFPIRRPTGNAEYRSNACLLKE